ncbi:uncharacterized protein N7511_006023 [Penicillium nucicola]|uniref:uncharacterized protein n=1 Tax=Penicillium nucicola TaxID=1850975 RepID=UPI00254569BA|nr:uncharacterized protein N7511_006023 [Penicillium nucicola]KAJ5757329.1 hypothetical protein N7511_006023 [Penicillium nucicola]
MKKTKELITLKPPLLVYGIVLVFTMVALTMNPSLLELPRIAALKDHLGPVSFSISFLAIVLYHTQHQISIYHRKFHKKKIYLYIHVFTGLTGAVRYRLNAIFQRDADLLPDALDVLFCLIWSWTSFELVKTLRRGDPRTTRPPYQAGACLRPVVTLISFFCGIPSLYKVAVYALDSFVYARLAIFFFSYTPYIRTYSASQIYAISIPLVAALSVHNSRVPGASLVFIFATAYIAKLNEWVTKQSQAMRQSSEASLQSSEYKKKLVSMLIGLGFVELEELRLVAEHDGIKKPVYDDYVSKKYGEEDF